MSSVMKIFGYSLTLLLLSAVRLSAQTAADKALADRSIPGNKIVIASAKDDPGIGNTEGFPEGDPLHLPKGIRIVQRVNHPFNPDLKLLHGNANAFYAEISLVNDNIADKDSIKTGAPVQMILDPGLVMFSTAPGRVQHGMLMDRVLINMPPTGIGAGGLKEQDTVTIYLGLVCLNKNKGIPWEENGQGPEDTREYPISIGSHIPGRITRHRGLLELVTILGRYPKLRLTKHYNPQLSNEEGYIVPKWMEIYDKIQDMVWKVTDGPGIMKSELQEFITTLQPYK
jgi:hypothetical protein